MEWINNLIFEAWKLIIVFPVLVRQIVFLLLAAFAAAVILLVIGPFVIRIASYLLVFFFNKLGAFMGWSINMRMQGRRKRNKGSTAMTNILEFFIDLLSVTAKQFKKLTIKRPKFKEKFKKVYIWAASVIVIGFPFLYQSDSQLSITQPWAQLETWMLQGQSADAVSSQVEEAEWKHSETGTVLIRLQSGYDGAKVREEPFLAAATVDVLGTGEEALFLQEEEVGSNINWLLVRLANGKEGWISSNIVEAFEE